MARIKINDIPKDLEISREEMKKVFGGTTYEDLSAPRYLTGGIYATEEDPWYSNTSSTLGLRSTRYIEAWNGQVKTL